MEKILRTFWPGSLFLMFVTVLLCLPGSTLPSSRWFDTIQLDKWIHVFLFATLVVLWSWPFTNRIQPGRLRLVSVRISLIAFAYGVSMELVQHYWIPDRSFDVLDILADAGGCAIGLLLSVRWLVKRVA